MIRTASSMNVTDMKTGKLLYSMRFTGPADALDYMSGARLMCSACGRHFDRMSTVTMMFRGNSWELMLPHRCEPAIRAENEIRENLETPGSQRSQSAKRARASAR